MTQNRGSKLFSRRDFLKVAITTAGGLVVAGCNRGNSTSLPIWTKSPITTPSPSPTIPIYSDPKSTIVERVNDLVDRMTIDEMVEYYRKGVVVGVKLRDDVIKIYQHVTNYLVHWNRILTTQINILDAPFEDLELMNQFADAVYDHAKWDLPKVDHEEFVFMDQSPISNTSILQGTRGEINHEDGEYVPPQRDSFAEAFSQVQESLNYNFYSGRNRGK